MTPEQQLIDNALRLWKFSVDRVEASLSNLSDEQLEVRVAAGRNRLIYLLGHIAAVHDRMLPLLGVGPRQHPELDAPFLDNPDGEAPTPISGDALKKILVDVNGTLWNAYNAWSPSDWLARHTSVSEEDFAKEPHRNRFSILQSRTAHLQFHHGQIVLTEPRRAD